MEIQTYLNKYGQIVLSDINRGITFYSNGKNIIGGKTTVKAFRQNNRSFY